MKARKLIVVGLLLISLLLMAFAPLPQEGDGLTEGQLAIVGVVASLLTWIVRMLAEQGYEPKREHVAIGLYVISFFTAIAFTPLTFPPFPPFADAPTFVAALLTYIGDLLALAAPVVGVAYLIYNVLLKRVLDGAAARVGGGG